MSAAKRIAQADMASHVPTGANEMSRALKNVSPASLELWERKNYLILSVNWLNQREKYLFLSVN